MTVRQLMKALKREDPDAEVAFASFDLDEDQIDGNVASIEIIKPGGWVKDGMVILRG